MKKTRIQNSEPTKRNDFLKKSSRVSVLSPYIKKQPWDTYRIKINRQTHIDTESQTNWKIWGHYNIIVQCHTNIFYEVAQLEIIQYYEIQLPVNDRSFLKNTY